MTTPVLPGGAAPLAPPELLTGERVRLRRSTLRDAPALFALAHDEQVMRYLDWPRQLAQGEAFAFLDAAALRWRDGGEYHWMIEDRDGSAVHGCIACRPRAFAVDFGLLLARSSWGRGLGTEAATLLLGWLRSRPPVHRIWALIDAEHERAARLLDRVGLRREGRLRRATLRPNLDPAVPRDSAVWAAVRGADY